MTADVLALVARADELVDGLEFRDTGCDVNPSCLECPLPACRYDDPGWAVRDRVVRARENIAAMQSFGWPVEEMAAVTGLSRRTVFRYLAGLRAQP